jgi:hypothetical protein
VGDILGRKRNKVMRQGKGVIRIGFGACSYRDSQALPRTVMNTLIRGKQLRNKLRHIEEKGDEIDKL